MSRLGAYPPVISVRNCVYAPLPRIEVTSPPGDAGGWKRNPTP